MTEPISLEIHKDLLPDDSGIIKYTTKAFRMLPQMDTPRILDIGCGRGRSTLEIARLSDGQITALDIDQSALEVLSNRMAAEGFSERIKTMNRSMFEMDFRDESFDVIWAEGSIFIIGFERGLKEWRRFLKTGGFLVVHEMVWLQPEPPREIREYWERIYPGICSIPENIECIRACGYGLVGHFALPEDTWWLEYYKPLEERVEKLRGKYADKPGALTVLEKEQHQIDLYKKYSQWYGSAFFIMQKK